MAKDTQLKGKGLLNASLSLSEALLAPLNSFFKVQVHATRSFLHYFLQLGFRLKRTEEDEAPLNENKAANSIINKPAPML